MKKEDIEKLLDKYKTGACTPDEQAFVESWYLSYEDTPTHPITEEERLSDLDEVWNNLSIIQQKKKIILWPRIAAAAILILSISIGLLLYTKQKNNIQKSVVHDVKPGRNKAILTLSDGTKISLSDAVNGELATQSGIRITKTADGQIVYDASAAKGQEIVLNTIEVPVGGQWQIKLPDGSLVFLNASSSFTYPTRFTGNERKVSLKGEAYFEIAHNSAMPFKVESQKQVVEVLGTHFNVMAYANEPCKTTLLEGAVKISGANTSKILQPGEQALLAGQSLTVKLADVEEAVAWKNGYFKFNESLKNIMNKISRWYDVEIVYDNEVDQNMEFGGEISRYKNLSSALNIMEMTGKVHFKIEKRRVIIMR